MRYLILLLLLPVSVFANIQNFVAEKRLGTTGVYTVFLNKAECEAVEKSTCYDITGKDIEVAELVAGRVVENSVLKEQKETAKTGKATELSGLITKLRNGTISDAELHNLLADMIEKKL